MKPLIVIRKSKILDAKQQGRGGTPPKLPSYGRQADRLGERFTELERVVNNKNINIQANANGVVPEQVLVLKTVGSVSDFKKAVSLIPGLDWLCELDEEDIPPDDDFYKFDKKKNLKKDDPLTGRLYLLMSNYQAIAELLNLWKSFKANPSKPLKKGYSSWKQVFKHLHEVRLWGVEDRFENTGAMEDWNEQLKSNHEKIRFQIETWFKRTSSERSQVTTEIRKILNNEGGRIISEYVLPSIAYHGILGEIPASAAQKVLSSDNVHILHCDYIMFARPLGQGTITTSDFDFLEDINSEDSTVNSGEPVVALFDGLPVQNHSLLRNKLIVDDPDNFSKDYESKDRIHGTAMASAIIHGGNLNTSPIKSPLYVRPLLTPGPSDINGCKREIIPENQLEVDLLHRSVKELFEGKEAAAGASPSIKIINYSIGDHVRQFDYMLSPVARVIDWLSWQYNVLFIVSAGNHNKEIELDCSKEEFNALSPQDKQKKILNAIITNCRERRLLAPAESLNALTVGACNHDNSEPKVTDYRFPVLSEKILPSTYSASGLGYRRSIKPDILVMGGRVFYTEKFNSGDKLIFTPSKSSSAPGIQLATPGSGTASKTFYDRGTSYSAAIASHYGEKIIHTLKDLSNIQEEYYPVLTKAILTHTARWDEAKNIIEENISTFVKKDKKREFTSRLLGYGTVNFERALSCTDNRATLITCDSITNGQGHVYEIPLPNDLSGKKEWRRLIITLAWITPTNSFIRPYRKAALWISNAEKEKMTGILKIDRNEADYRSTMRGTLQHEILEGDKAVAFTDKQTIKIQVNCREDATELVERIRYGLVVSLEVKEGVPIQVYNQIISKIPARVRQVIKV